MTQRMTAEDKRQIINIANKFQLEAQIKDGTGVDVYDKQIKLLHVPSGNLVFLDKKQDYRRSGFKVCVHPEQFSDSICDGTNISRWKSTKIGPRLTPHSAFKGFPVDSAISKEPLGACYRVKGDFPTLEALFRKLVAAFESTGPGSISFESDMALENEPLHDTGASGIRQPISVEELQAQLDRRSEIGEAGELIALKFERQRVGAAEVGCPDPERYVEHVALTDAGRGYDIETTWPGHERCIEVKSSTGSGNDIFMSDNEWTVLEALGKKAWLYRVIVNKNGGDLVLRFNDPISKIPKDNISTAVWRIRLPKSDK